MIPAEGDPCYLKERPGWGSGLLAFSLPRPHYCGQLGSETAHRRFSFSLSNINMSYTKKTIWFCGFSSRPWSHSSIIIKQYILPNLSLLFVNRGRGRARNGLGHQQQDSQGTLECGRWSRSRKGWLHGTWGHCNWWGRGGVTKKRHQKHTVLSSSLF